MHDELIDECVNLHKSISEVMNVSSGEDEDMLYGKILRSKENIIIKYCDIFKTID